MPGAWASGIFALDCQYDRIVQEMDRICLGKLRQDVYNRQKIKNGSAEGGFEKWRKNGGMIR